MGEAVWDTYARISNGNVLHFDILVPGELTDAAVVLDYGRAYLQGLGEDGSLLGVAESQYCHMEEPDAAVASAIARDGHYILDLGEIPSSPPALPSRRDMILHLRAFHAQHRFADFKEKSWEEVQAIFLAAIQGE